MLDGIDMTDDDHTSRDSSARSPRTGKSRWPFLFSAKTAVVPFTAQARAKRQRKEKDPNREMLALLFFQVLFFSIENTFSASLRFFRWPTRSSATPNLISLSKPKLSQAKLNRAQLNCNAKLNCNAASMKIEISTSKTHHQ